MMMKGIEILIVILFLVSCSDKRSENASHFSDKVELSSNLCEVINSFHEQRCVQGVPSIRIHSYCESKIAEVWCVKGWAELEENRPRYYSEYKGFAYLIYDGLGSIVKEQLSDEKLFKLVGVQLEEDIGLPPRTGFPHKWLYRLDYSQDRVYSMVDSLFKYDDDNSFNRNLKQYTGDHICK